MNIRNIVIVLVAVMVAGFTAMMVRGYLIAQREAMKPPPVVAEAPKAVGPSVLVAKAKLAPGTFVQASHLQWVEWPKEGVVKGFVIKGERTLEEFVGSVARIPVNPGEPIIEQRFAKPGDRGFLAAVLNPGYRAMTVPITSTSGNAGFVFPGDLVDLILTGKYGENQEKQEENRHFAATVLSRVRVLAIDQKTEYGKGEVSVGKTATVEVDPKQAEIVALALQMGQVALSLRAMADQPNSASDGAGSGESVATASATSGAPKLAKPKPEQDRSYTVDRQLQFMLDGNGLGKRQVIILRGKEEAKAAF